MRVTHVMTCLLVSWVAVSGCSNGDPGCKDSDCMNPPADTCLDADTLRDFDPQGACDAGTGECDYEYTDRVCQAGCSEDHCRSEDPCMGVVCDQPPENRCEDASTLWIFDAQGVCVRPQGTCDYDYSERTCSNGCQDGQCLGVDPGEGVVCDDPPWARCLESSWTSTSCSAWILSRTTVASSVSQSIPPRLALPFLQRVSKCRSRAFSPIAVAAV